MCANELRLLPTFQSITLRQIAYPDAIRFYVLAIPVVRVYPVVPYDEHIALPGQLYMKRIARLRTVVLHGILDEQLQTERQNALSPAPVQFVGGMKR